MNTLPAAKLYDECYSKHLPPTFSISASIRMRLQENSQLFQPYSNADHVHASLHLWDDGRTLGDMQGVCESG